MELTELSKKMEVDETGLLEYLQILNDKLEEMQNQLTTITEQQEEIITKLENISISGDGFQTSDGYGI